MLRPFSVAFTAMPIALFDARVDRTRRYAPCLPHGAGPSTLASAEPTASFTELDALQQAFVW
jgi:hypothetical protein